MSLGLAAAVLLAGAGGVQEGPTPPVEAETTVQGVTVTATRPVITSARKGPALLDPFEAFRELCFEPNRLHGRSARPAGDPAWRVLGGEDRRRLGVESGGAAYGRFDLPQLSLVLKVEDQTPFSGVVEHRCSLTVAGRGADHAGLERRVAALFGGAATHRRIDGRYNYPQSWPGWSNAIWTATPPHGSRDWTVWRAGSAGAPSDGTFVVVTHERHYRRHDYVVGDLRRKLTGDVPVSVLMLNHTRRR